MFRILGIGLTILGLRLWVAPVSKIRIPNALPKVFMRSVPKFQDLQLISLLTAVRQELVAGLPVTQALANIVIEQPIEILPHSRNALGDTTNLLDALSEDADQIGSSELKQLVKILKVNKSSGASITEALDMMIRTALIRHERTHQIAAELSGIKATITVLALLPIFGSFLGVMMGVNVPYWLLMTPVGWGCLILACTFEALGLFWVRKLIRGVS
ncbi:MAG: hypothetical protein WCK30_03720 [Actinomycetes bacterium]